MKLADKLDWATLHYLLRSYKSLIAGMLGLRQAIFARLGNLLNLVFVEIIAHIRQEPAEEKYFRDSCSWNLSKFKTFSPDNQIARDKHNDDELEL